MTGPEIRKAREDLELSLTDLANAAGLHKQTLSMIELGKSVNPTYTNIMKIEAALKAAGKTKKKRGKK